MRRSALHTRRHRSPRTLRGAFLVTLVPATLVASASKPAVALAIGVVIALLLVGLSRLRLPLPRHRH